MAAPPQKLARSLEALKSLQDRGVVAIRSSDLERIDRERAGEAAGKDDDCGSAAAQGRPVASRGVTVLSLRTANG